MDTQKSASAHTSADLNASSKSSLQSSSTQARRGRRWLPILATISAAVLFMYCGPPNISLLLNAISRHQDIPSAYAVCTPSEAGIYTVDDEDSKVECMLVNGDKIAFTGTRDEINAYWGASYPHLGLKIFEASAGSVVVPGLADSHAHFLEWGFKQQLPLEGASSVNDILEKLKAYVLSHPDVRHNHSRWILGMGWDQTKWPSATFPTADDFDREPLLRDRPIALSRVDAHALWVSNSVLKIINDSLPDSVDGGLIVRDDQHRPTGVFVDNAMEFIPVPEWTDEQTAEYFDIAVRDAFSVGLTSVHDAMSTPHHIEFFKRMADEGKLPIRLYLMGHISSEDYWGANLTRLIDYGLDGRLNLRSVKLFTDGALGSWGAALLEPYTDDPTTSGLMRISESKLKALVEDFHTDGWQVNIHCIGDRANKVAIDIFEGVLTSNGSPSVDEWRPRIEHAQIMRLEDLERVGHVGIITSVQPTHATSDMWYAETRLGPERIKGAYAYQTLLRNSQKGILPLGSDFPVEGINPLLGFYAAVSRLSVHGDSPSGTNGWYTSESLTRTQALRGMTRDAAYASFAEHSLGMLIPGMKADFVILDRDIVDEKKVAVGDILGTKVLGTVVDGRIVYGSL